jgi:sec-independent protein translocase protein TatC
LDRKSKVIISLVHVKIFISTFAFSNELRMKIGKYKRSVEAGSQENEMTFWDHLEDLRGSLFRSVIAIVVFGITAFIFKGVIFDQVILAPKNNDFITFRLLCKLGKMLSIDSFCFKTASINLINIELAGQFMSHLMISIIVGLVVAIPYIIWELWRFIKPGLTEHERKNTRGAVFIISMLFLTGVLFSYFLVVPLMINFLGNYQVSAEVTNQIALTSYTSSVTMMTLIMGLIFEFPILIVFLTKIGIVTPSLLRKYRKHTVIGILIIAGLITLSPDIFSQLIVAVPLYGLYEISVSISSRMYRKREKMEETEELAG